MVSSGNTKQYSARQSAGRSWRTPVFILLFVAAPHVSAETRANSVVIDWRGTIPAGARDSTAVLIDQSAAVAPALPDASTPSFNDRTLAIFPIDVTCN